MRALFQRFFSRRRSLAMALLSFSVSTGLTVFSQAAIVERIVAIVNDEIITLTDLHKFSERIKSGGLTDDLLLPNEEARQAVLKDEDKLLQTMIDARILDSEVKKQNLSVTIERVEQEIRSIARRNNVSREGLRAALEERGVSFSQYQDFIKTGLERQSLIEKEVTSKIKISEEDVLAALSGKNGQAARQAYEYTLSHILFLNENGGAESARQRGEQALARLKRGIAFEKVAAEMSEAPGFEEGGALGVFKPGELAGDLERTLQKLAQGEYTGVLPTRNGFHIVKVNKKRVIADPRTEKEREQARAKLYEKAYKKQFASWMEQLRQDAFIRINAK